MILRIIKRLGSDDTHINGLALQTFQNCGTSYNGSWQRYIRHCHNLVFLSFFSVSQICHVCTAIDVLQKTKLPYALFPFPVITHGIAISWVSGTQEVLRRTHILPASTRQLCLFSATFSTKVITSFQVQILLRCSNQNWLNVIFSFPNESFTSC